MAIYINNEARRPLREVDNDAYRPFALSSAYKEAKANFDRQNGGRLSVDDFEVKVTIVRKLRR